VDRSQLHLVTGFLRRRWWIIAQAVVVVGLVSAFIAHREPDAPFQATATVSVRLDPNTDNSFFTNSPAGFLSNEAAVVRSPPVIDAAAKATPDIPASEIAGSLSVGADQTVGDLFITARSGDPTRATTTANAVATSYIAFRNGQQTGKLQGAANDVDRRVNDLFTALSGQEQQVGQKTAAVDALTHARSLIVPPLTADTTKQIAALNDQLVAAQSALSAATAARDSSKAQYGALLPQQQDLHNKLATTTPSAGLVAAASGTFRPAKPSPLTRGLLGAGIGLVVGLGLAVLLEAADDRLRTRRDIEQVTSAPVAGQIPLDRELAKRKSTGLLPIIDRPAHGFAESIRALRTSLTFLSAEKPIHCIAVTSAEPDDGKSMVAANLAAAYAQAGVTTILVSGDLRRPTLEVDLFPRGRRQPGLSDLIVQPVAPHGGNGDAPLADPAAADPLPAPTAPPRHPVFRSTTPSFGNGPTRVEDLLVPTKIVHLKFLGAGTLPPNPAELLAGRAAAEVFKDIRANAEMVVIDSPPTAVADAALLASMADGVLVVTSMNKTRGSNLAAAMGTLAAGNLRVLGIVVNRARQHDGTGYGYSYTSYVPAGLTPRRRRGRRRR